MNLREMINSIENLPTEAGLTQNITKVLVFHELPLRNNQGFSHMVRKS